MRGALRTLAQLLSTSLSATSRDRRVRATPA
jgi:hypothetical protein